MATQPYEIIAAPFTLWIAAVGEPFPAIEDAPAGNWAKIGSSGDLNYSEDGVVVSHPQTNETFTSLGSTGPRKAFRTNEEFRVALSVADMTLEQYKHALNENLVKTVAPGAAAGYKKIGLSRGLDVAQMALLIRGASSAYGDGWNAQFEVPIVVEMSEQEITFQKGEAAMLSLEYLALEDPNAASVYERFGRLVIQNADPT